MLNTINKNNDPINNQDYIVKIIDFGLVRNT